MAHCRPTQMSLRGQTHIPSLGGAGAVPTRAAPSCNTGKSKPGRQTRTGSHRSATLERPEQVYLPFPLHMSNWELYLTLTYLHDKCLN